MLPIFPEISLPAITGEFADLLRERLRRPDVCVWDWAESAGRVLRCASSTPQAEEAVREALRQWDDAGDIRRLRSYGEVLSGEAIEVCDPLCNAYALEQIRAVLVAIGQMLPHAKRKPKIFREELSFTYHEMLLWVKHLQAREVS